MNFSPRATVTSLTLYINMGNALLKLIFWHKIINHGPIFKIFVAHFRTNGMWMAVKKITVDSLFRVKKYAKMLFLKDGVRRVEISTIAMEYFFFIFNIHTNQQKAEISMQSFYVFVAPAFSMSQYRNQLSIHPFVCPPLCICINPNVAVYFSITARARGLILGMYLHLGMTTHMWVSISIFHGSPTLSFLRQARCKSFFLKNYLS